MADIDMIPRSYRDGLRVRRMLAIYGGALGLLLAVGGGASALVRWQLAVETPRLEQARASALQSAALRTQLASAQARKDTLLEGIGALGALRGAGEIDALGRVFATALNDNVWFDQLRFTRSEELLQAASSPLPPGAVQTRTPGSGEVQTWRLGSHVEIDGSALDSAAMTAFLGALAADPGLGNVRFLNSSMQAPDAGGAITFKVAASLLKQKDLP